MKEKDRLRVLALAMIADIKKGRHLLSRGALVRFAEIKERVQSGGIPVGFDIAYLRGLYAVTTGRVPVGNLEHKTHIRECGKWD